jgi:hypothetical protein
LFQLSTVQQPRTDAPQLLRAPMRPSADSQCPRAPMRTSAGSQHPRAPILARAPQLPGARAQPPFDNGLDEPGAYDNADGAGCSFW